MTGGEARIKKRRQLVAGALWLVLLSGVPKCNRADVDTAEDAGANTSSAHEEEPATAARPNILMWLVDALRADHLSVYGYSRKTSPRLEAFATDAVVFENACSPSSWTKPATASLLTGVYPSRHGAVGWHGRLSGVRLIGEYLKTAGYQTVALTTNPWVRPFWGFGPGFDMFNPTRRSLNHARASRMAAVVRAYLEATAVQPFFCYVHTLDPHSTYAPPAPYDTMWGPRLERRAVPERPAWMRSAPPHVVEDMMKGYDGEIAFGDHHFGRVLDDLKRRGLYEDSLIVFMSDHGEAFFEHGHGGHGLTLHGELVRVPLIVKFPGNARAGRRVSARVSLVDVVPTVLACVGLAGAEALDGVDLATVVDRPTGQSPDRPFFMQSDLTLRASQSPEQWTSTGVSFGRYKYIEQSQPFARKMLFDVMADPGERVDLFASDPAAGAALANLLSSYGVDSEPGIHFRNINVIEKSARAHTFRVRFRTEGKFVDLRRRQLEERDVAELVDGGRALRLLLYGVNRGDHIQLRKRGRWLVDEDGVSFNVEPPNAKIVVEDYRCDDSPDICLHVGSEKTPVATLPYEFSAERLEVIARDVFGLLQPGLEYSVRGPAGGYLAVVPARSRAAEGDLDEGMLESLRSLGYIGE